VNELFSKLKSAEMDRGMTAKIEGPTDSHSLVLIGGSKGKANANPSTRMFSLSSLTSMPDEEFYVLGDRGENGWEKSCFCPFVFLHLSHICVYTKTGRKHTRTGRETG
jgi:hypothetical protein